METLLNWMGTSGRAELLKYWSVEVSLSWLVSGSQVPTGQVKRPHNKEKKDSQTCLTLSVSFHWFFRCCSFYHSRSPWRGGYHLVLMLCSVLLDDTSKRMNPAVDQWISKGHTRELCLFSDLQNTLYILKECKRYSQNWNKLSCVEYVIRPWGHHLCLQK